MTALDDLLEALQTARESVFRFEGRQDYPDDELWQAHLRGEWWEQDRDLIEWCALVSAAVDRGVTWIRARVVTEPWTDYTRWEIEQHFPHNLTAGEDIRLVHSPDVWLSEDFWIVDGRAWLLLYGPTDGMTVYESTVSELPELRAVQARALRAATPMPMPASP